MTDIREEPVDFDGNPIPVRIEYEVPHERWDVFQQHPQTVRKVIEVIFMQDNHMVGRVDFEQGDDPWTPVIKMTIHSYFWHLFNTHAALFARLANRDTLADVKRLLDEVGAEDRTDRVDRSPSAPSRRAIAEWQRVESPGSARAAAGALLAWATDAEAPPF